MFKSYIMIKISLVIPVYNVEKYLEKCLNSCVNQDIPIDEYEIIIVNDGTKDNSLNIANEFEQKYSNIKVYSQENQGLSATRNRGLFLANGEYVWFIDSDDWIERNCLKSVIEEIQGNDLLVMGYIEAYDDESRNKVISYKNHNLRNGKQLLSERFFPQAQMYIYRRTFLLESNLKFFEGIYHEDTEFTPRMLYFADKIKILNEPIYYFYKRPNSITTSSNPKKAFDCIIVAKSLSVFSENIDKNLKTQYNNLISLYLNNSLYNTFVMTKEKKNELNLFICEHKYLFKHLIRSNRLKYIMEGILFRIFPKKTVQVYQIIQKFNVKSV